MDSSSLLDNTASIGELSKEFAKQQRAKSPPLAFEPTPNDALAAPNYDDSNTTSPQHRAGSMGPYRYSPSPQNGETRDLQAVIERQALAMRKLHDAFAVEREAWDLDRARLVGRIASLERLLGARGSHR